VGVGHPVTGGTGGQPPASAPAKAQGGPPKEPPEEPRQRERPAKPRRWSLPRTRRYLSRFSLAGLTGALAFLSSAMHWYPLVTFWQVVADLALAAGVPSGHGHTYGTLQAASAWASIIPPPGWTADRTAELGALAAN
jgi:Alpha/beta-hydrolase family